MAASDKRRTGKEIIMSLSPETRIKELFLHAISNKKIGAIKMV
jgi:hypothetical protein